ncbi:MAG: hypothetical protein M5U01_31955 [Ardenticatenaceae bacterium]|nr:hypothetical protein [Ardenticatenaceae bacterium]
MIPLGLVAGVALGLYLAWDAWAMPSGTASVAQLRREERVAYVRLVAAGYAEEHDLRRARTRLARLPAGNVALWVAELAQQDAAAGRATDAQRLARMAYGLGITDPTIVSLAALPTPTLQR